MRAESPFDRGRRGEDVAARALESAGGRIIARNWRDGPRELDLVVLFEGVVAFVEVKTRRDERWGHPLEALTPRKRGEIERAARAWIGAPDRPRIPGSPDFRFDVVSVTLEGEGAPRVEHLPDAWRPGW